MDAFFDRHGVPHELPVHQTVRERSSAYAAVVEDGLVLLVLPQQSHLLEFPGGKVEPGESDTQALCRESLEEAGYEISPEPEPFLTLRTRFYSLEFDEYYKSRMSFYMARIVAMRGTTADTYEIRQALWRPIETVAEEELQHMHRHALRALPR